MPWDYDKPSWLMDDGSVDYDSYISSSEWAETRAERMRIDHMTCVCCGRSSQPLQVHHLTYANLGHERMDDLVTLCETCHSVITQVEKEIPKAIKGTLRDWRWVRMLANSQMFPNAIGAQIIHVILQAVVDHQDNLGDLNRINQNYIEDYISNVMELVRDTKRQEMDEYVLSSPKGIAQKLKANTRKGTSTVDENVRLYYNNAVLPRLKKLPKRDDYQGDAHADN